MVTVYLVRADVGVDWTVIEEMRSTTNRTEGDP